MVTMSTYGRVLSGFKLPASPGESQLVPVIILFLAKKRNAHRMWNLLCSYLGVTFTCALAMLRAGRLLFLATSVCACLSVRTESRKLS